MDKNILSDEKIQQLAKSLNAEEESFSKYMNIFQNLYTTAAPTSFTNYFHDISLFELEKVNGINNEDSFLKAIATFINEVTYNKSKIQFELSDEESIRKVIKVLKMLKTPKKYVYDISKAKPKKKTELPKLDIDFVKNKEIFEYIDFLSNPQFFTDFTKKAIEEEVELAKIYYLDLDKISSDKVINYSTKYPNRIKELYAFENREYDKIKKICELNAESLIRTPNCKIDLYPFLKKIEIITINSEILPSPLPQDFNYDSVKELDTIAVEDDSEEQANKALELINKCKNVEIVSFSANFELTQEQLFAIFSKTTSKKIRVIEATCQEMENDVDFSPIFHNLPKLSKFNIDCHCSMEYIYGVLPCISCEKVAPAYPLIEQLLINYIKEDEDNYINGDFPTQFQEFWDYFKDKKEIIQRFSTFTGEGCNQFEIPYFSEITVKKTRDIKNLNVKKIQSLNIYISLDDIIVKFIEKTKPVFLRINEKALPNNIKTDECKIIYNMGTNTININ